MGHIRIAATRSPAIKVIEGSRKSSNRKCNGPTTEEILFNYDILLSEHLCKYDKTFYFVAIQGLRRF